MLGQMDAVTVRRLPDGEPQTARIENGERRHILITLENEACQEFPLGSLVEAQSPETLYLGQVLELRDLRLVVAVEHAINRATLAEIDEMWRKPQGA